MKMFQKLALGILFIVAASINGATTIMAQSRMYGSSYNNFYDDLAPYGRWIPNREFGMVWVPDVESDFRPYASAGRWVMTEYGNTWVSDYDWGWAPFHYGRWTYDNFYGWIWIPGNEWAPAWVSWRCDNDYYGWAPLGPGIDVGIEINIPVNRWIFVPKIYFTHHNISRYCLPPQRVSIVYRNTVVIRNEVQIGPNRYVCGPGRDDIERHGHQRVNIYRIESDGRPGRYTERAGTVSIYRPTMPNHRNDHGEYRDWGKDTDWRQREAQNQSTRNRWKSNPSNYDASQQNRNEPSTQTEPRTSSYENGKRRPNYNQGNQPSYPENSGTSSNDDYHNRNKNRTSPSYPSSQGSNSPSRAQDANSQEQGKPSNTRPRPQRG